MSSARSAACALSLLVVTAISTVVGVVAAVLLGQQVAKPLREVQAVMETVAAGDLTQTLPVRSQDEVGALAQAVNTTIADLRNAVELVLNSAQGLNDIARKWPLRFRR